MSDHEPPFPAPERSPEPERDDEDRFAYRYLADFGHDSVPVLSPEEEQARRAEEERRRAEEQERRAEEERRERARRSWNPLVRATAGFPRWARVAIDWIATIVGAVAIVLAVKAWVVNPYRIPSSSMEPTLHCARPGSGCEARFSDRVLANRFIYHFRKPSRGDIIVFKTPPAAQQKCGAGGTFVKRLIALPGETWEEKNGFVYINGQKLDESYVKADRRDNQSFPARKIPPGRYFFMGDNRSQSCDSREWGPVPRQNIIGQVFFIYWPPNRIGFRAALLLFGFVLVLPPLLHRRRTTSRDASA